MIHDLFSTPIYRTNVETPLLTLTDVQSFKENYPSEIHSNVGGYQSKSFQLNDYFLSQLKLHLKKYLHLKQFDVFGDGMWININSKGHYNVPHTHTPSDFAGVYYLKVPENSGDIYFVNSGICNHIVNYVKDVGSVVHIKPKVNDLILFPSQLLHGVTPNFSDDERVSVSFNLIVSNYV